MEIWNNTGEFEGLHWTTWVIQNLLDCNKDVEYKHGRIRFDKRLSVHGTQLRRLIFES